MNRYQLNGTRYWVYNDDQKLPVIILVHGLRGTHHGLDLIAKGLEGYRVIVPDLPGFGTSEPLPSTHSIENYAEWLGQFINGLELKQKPVLFGHSFGTIVTGRFATKHSDKISKLILVNPIAVPALEGNNAIASQLSVFYYWLGRVLPEPIGTKLLSSKLVTLIMSATLAKTRDKKLRKWIHREHFTHFSSFKNRQVVSEAFHASITKNVGKYAPNITAKTLLIAGDIDDITPLEQQHELVKKFPNAELIILKNVGHLTHYEKPAEIATAVKEFIKK